jgi:hypothetical protein
MSAGAKPNPFHVLGLPVDATETEIVHRGQELVELAETAEETQLARWAIQELSTHPATRRVHELLEVPDPQYRQEEWERFERRNRRNPVDLDALAEGSPPLRTKDFDLRAILGLLLDDVLSPPPVDLRPAVENPPVPPAAGAPPIEVNDVVFG